MKGYNSAGRSVSLLHDEDLPVRPITSTSTCCSSSNGYASYTAAPIPLTPSSTIILPSGISHSRTSSLSSWTSQVPQLVRTDSTDSSATLSPSPVTPKRSSFDDGVYPSGAPILPAGIMVPEFAVLAKEALQQKSPPRVSQKRVGAMKSKKNTYPCPLAKEYNCHDYFTTSGHAARHSKKHTGKKDAICPQCNKAFTRKDNMEQHRRTHRDGRNITTGRPYESTPSTSRRAKESPKKKNRADIPVLPSNPVPSFYTLADTSRQNYSALDTLAAAGLAMVNSRDGRGPAY